MHEGHRKRVREKFRQTGFKGFADHEILELLLFYAIPRADTNTIAHRLVDRFGSLAGVLKADEEELMKVEGIGENAAFLIAMIPALTEEFYKRKEDRPRLKTSMEAAEYVKRMMFGWQTEKFVVLCLDMKYRLIYSEIVFEGSSDKLPVYMKKIVAAAINNNASRVIACHNHPGGSPRPSQADVSVTEKLMKALGSVGIPLVDHIIAAGEKHYSMFGGGMGFAFAAEEELSAAQNADYS